MRVNTAFIHAKYSSLYGIGILVSLPRPHTPNEASIRFLLGTWNFVILLDWEAKNNARNP